jgi:hypothetical protein
MTDFAKVRAVRARATDPIVDLFGLILDLCDAIAPNGETADGVDSENKSEVLRTPTAPVLPFALYAVMTPAWFLDSYATHERAEQKVKEFAEERPSSGPYRVARLVEVPEPPVSGERLRQIANFSQFSTTSNELTSLADYLDRLTAGEIRGA